MRLQSLLYSWIERHKKLFFNWIKVFIVLVSGYFIYQQLYNKELLSFQDFYTLVNSRKITHPKSLLILLACSALNWGLELFKWKLLVQTLQPITFYQSFMQVMSSHAAALATPNKIGEIGIKPLYYPANKRKKIIGLTFITNLTQLIWTFVFGSIGLLFFKQLFYTSELFKTTQLGLYSTLTIILIIFIYYFKKRLLQWSFIKKLQLFIQSIPKKTLLKTFILSGIRYLVFSHQFFLILLLLGASIDYHYFLILISSMYFLSSILPTLNLLDVIVKSGIAIWLFSFNQTNQFIVLCTTTLMWLFNAVVPALIGYFYLFQIKAVQAQ